MVNRISELVVEVEKTVKDLSKKVEGIEVAIPMEVAWVVGVLTAFGCDMMNDKEFARGLT